MEYRCQEQVGKDIGVETNRSRCNPYKPSLDVRLFPATFTHRIAFISIGGALCTSRSRMPSATLGSPICSCQRVAGRH